MLPPLLPVDKVNHYVYGQAIFGISTASCYLAPPGASLWLSVAIGCGVVALFAVGKEIRDKVTGKGTPDLLDAVATMAGCVIPTTLLAIAF